MSCPSILPACLHRALIPRSVDSAEQCEDHEERLSMFCLDDLEPLCQQCVAVSHVGHRVYLLTEAATDCKEELRTSLNTLKKKMTHFEKVTRTCEDAYAHNQAEAELTEENMKKEFENLHQFLRDEEAARLLALGREREEKKREADEQIDRTNQVITSLEEKIRLVEEELDAGGDGVGFLEHCQDTMNSTWTDGPMVCRPLDVAKHLGNLQYAEWEEMKRIAPYTPLTFDPRTAGQCLTVSPGLNSVHIAPGPPQSRTVPANPERFHPYSCILAREGFDSGVHCWDIEVGNTNNWTVGVAAQSVSRRAEFEACPEEGLWCISLRGGSYLALTTPAQTLNSRHLCRVRVRLDWDEGTLEFTDADTDTHLFMFRHGFAEKVYPYFESIASCGGFTVLAQRVKVSVASDFVPAKDTAVSEEDQVVKSNTALAKSNKETSEIVCATEDKSLLICSIREEKKKAKPQRCNSKDQLIKTKPVGKEKTKGDKPAVKTQSNKPRFSVTYHVSLNRAQQ